MDEDDMAFPENAYVRAEMAREWMRRSTAMHEALHAVFVLKAASGACMAGAFVSLVVWSVRTYREESFAAPMVAAVVLVLLAEALSRTFVRSAVASFSERRDAWDEYGDELAASVVEGRLTAPKEDA